MEIHQHRTIQLLQVHPVRARVVADPLGVARQAIKQMARVQPPAGMAQTTQVVRRPLAVALRKIHLIRVRIKPIRQILVRAIQSWAVLMIWVINQVLHRVNRMGLKRLILMVIRVVMLMVMGMVQEVNNMGFLTFLTCLMAAVSLIGVGLSRMVISGRFRPLLLLLLVVSVLKIFCLILGSLVVIHSRGRLFAKLPKG
ncbi:hypothetical protein HMPREF2954_00075 [Neisseria sp. HMSC067H09]|nr:hypothetical protein HMPREF2954_00075 [Neisseria sp. HMSC067H09]